MNLDTEQHLTITASLRYISLHAYWYMEQGTAITNQNLEKAAQEFEERIYPTLTSFFGVPSALKAQGDSRITILNANIPGVAGYVSEMDQFPPWVNPYSNQRPMIYMNIAAVGPGSQSYTAVLAHELQHLLHWYADSNEEVWVNEGLSELATNLAGFEVASLRSFLNAPDTQLNDWAEKPQDSLSHYGAAYLFMKYLYQHYEDKDGAKELVAEKEDGILGINRYLAQKGYQKDFDSIFQDWTIANYLDDPQGGSYSYPDISVRVKTTETVSNPGQRSDTVHQYAADYIDLQLKGDFLINFAGNSTVKILPNTPHSGFYQWWSQRGDAIDSTLSREFDLTGLTKATLQFWLWYDIEKGWDYAYLEVSSDGGKTWNMLTGPHTTPENPVGNSYGPGYTGVSGGGVEPTWIEENIDLTPYAGKKILLRFEYITDEAVSNNGLALDDISIPELGFLDDAESDRGWQAQGFVRTDNVIPQRFSAQVIEIGGKNQVVLIPLDSTQRGSLEVKGLGREWKQAILVVAALAPYTTEVAPYQFSIVPVP